MKLVRPSIPVLLCVLLVGKSERISRAADAAGQDGGESARREAAAHFARGVEHADRGAWSDAAEEFVRAYAALPRFGVLYNLGQSYLALDRPLEALETLERYLAEGGNEIPAARRARVESQLALLRGRVATLQVTVRPADARLAIDGREIPRTAAAAGGPALVRLLPGPHDVSAHRDGHESRTLQVLLEGGQTHVLELTLVRLPTRSDVVGEPAPPSPPMLVSPPDKAGAGSGGRALAYGFAGASLALGGTALGLYLWNDARHEDWEREDRALEADRTRPTFVEDQNANNDLWRSIHRVDLITWGLLAGAALTGTVAAFILVRRRRPAAQPPPTSTSIVPLPGGWMAAIEARW
jgi:hypothetical protein